MSARPYADSPCWELVTTKGEPFPHDGDMVPHYATEAEATADRDAYGYLTGLVPRQRLDMCLLITCDGPDGCYAELEDDELGPVHFGAEELPAVFQLAGWTNTGTHDLCPGCTAAVEALVPAGYRPRDVEGQQSLVTTSAEDTRELTFTFEISTTLGAGDEVNPTMRYVGDWLNDNNYGYRQVGPPVLTSSPPVFPLGYVPDAQ